MAARLSPDLPLIPRATSAATTPRTEAPEALASTSLLIALQIVLRSCLGIA